ncbi:MAG TPA: amidohydrolase [Ignavibacteria bacterium]|nr:amidohydrolase [Ignavibacteria bacterium]
MLHQLKFLSCILIAVTVFGCGKSAKDTVETKNKADAIYYGGDIITMEGETPAYAEAIAINDGKIIFVGSRSEAEKFKGDSTVMHDLKGQTLLPGFIDAHGHAFNAGIQAASANLLAPPDGTCTDIPSLISLLKEWASKNQNAIGKYGWIAGFGYDDSQLKEKRHPTAEDLDAVSDSIPVLIIHQSGHLASMNSKALELAGYNENSKDPAGGIIRRKEGSKQPNGVLEEMAFFLPLFSMMSVLDPEANEKIALAGVDAYKKFGYTTLQEGRASNDACETWFNLGKKGILDVDIACYPDIQTQVDYMKEKGTQKDYKDHVRIAGVKLSLDGSPQGKTAWLTEPYVVPPPGQNKDYKGYPAIPKTEDAESLIEIAYKNNWQLLTHVNGDAAIDEYIAAVRTAVDKYGNDDRRTVAIHSQTARFDQLDSMKVLKIIPSFFGMHTFYWGDWHVNETLGKDRAYRISPAGTALKKGMIFTEHHDAPVALPNSIMILYSVVNRKSRSGEIIGPDERISPYNALRSITTWAAYQYFEENNKGSLKEGKLADLVILSDNPLKIEPEKIKDIVVNETIKEGKTVYKK